MKALELADRLDRHAEHHFDAAQECDTRPCDTRNWEHFEASKHAAAELRRLAAVESDCATYLKEGETPAERIKRALGDADSLMSLYRDVVAERDALKAELERIKALKPVAWMVYSGNLDKVPIYPPFKTPELAEVAASMIKSDTEIRSLYALGSKTLTICADNWESRMTDTLKPCPFCGKPARLENLGDHHGAYHNLGCSDRTCIGYHVIYTESERTVSESVSTWNRRAHHQGSSDD